MTQAPIAPPSSPPSGGSPSSSPNAATEQNAIKQAEKAKLPKGVEEALADNEKKAASNEAATNSSLEGIALTPIGLVTNLFNLRNHKIIEDTETFKDRFGDDKEYGRQVNTSLKRMEDERKEFDKKNSKLPREEKERFYSKLRQGHRDRIIDLRYGALNEDFSDPNRILSSHDRAYEEAMRKHPVYARRANRVNYWGGARNDPHIKQLHQRIADHTNHRIGIELDAKGINNHKREKIQKLLSTKDPRLQAKAKGMLKRHGIDYKELHKDVVNKELNRFKHYSPRKYNAYKNHLRKIYGKQHVFPHSRVRIFFNSQMGRVGKFAGPRFRGVMTRGINSLNKSVPKLGRALSRLKAFKNTFSFKKLFSKIVMRWIIGLIISAILTITGAITGVFGGGTTP